MERYHDAFNCYDEVLKLYPKSIQAWESKARLLEKVGRNQDALDVYDNILKINPEDASSWLAKAGIYMTPLFGWKRGSYYIN